MYNLFGFNILSKEEKEIKRREYESLIFPGSEEQKKEVEEKLFKSVPNLDKVLLRYFYISVKERMKRGGLNFEDAVKKVGKRATPPGIKDRDYKAIKNILEEDLRDEHDRYCKS